VWPIPEFHGEMEVTKYFNDVSKHSLGDLNRVAKGSLIFQVTLSNA